MSENKSDQTPITPQEIAEIQALTGADPVAVPEAQLDALLTSSAAETRDMLFGATAFNTILGYLYASDLLPPCLQMQDGVPILPDEFAPSDRMLAFLGQEWRQSKLDDATLASCVLYGTLGYLEGIGFLPPLGKDVSGMLPALPAEHIPSEDLLTQMGRVMRRFGNMSPEQMSGLLDNLAVANPQSPQQVIAFFQGTLTPGKD